MLELRRLRLLYELDRRGTIAAVAEALHLAPSGVSQQLSQLEVEAGVTLLVRVGRNVRLTAAARLLVERTKNIIAELERADADLAAFATEPRGTVRVAAFQTAAARIIPAALTLLRRYQELRVEVHQAEPEDALPALLARDYDLVITEEYPGLPAEISPDIHYDLLGIDPIRLIRVGGRATQSREELQSARSDRWVMEPLGSASRQWASAMCRSAGFEPDVQFEASDISVHVELVQQGLASAFIPDLAWDSHQRTELLGSTPPPENVRRISAAVRRGSEENPALTSVREALRTALKHASAAPRRSAG